MLKRIALLFVVVSAITSLLIYNYAPSWWHPLYLSLVGERTVAEVADELGPGAERRLMPRFRRANVPYPPERVVLVGLKSEHKLELWAERSGAWVRVQTYPVLAASGGPGPKLREGDRQVPEGIYNIVALNPNSSYHLSMKLDYPNDFDIKAAREDGRTRLGGDIFIHGNAVSIGCLAVGDRAIEELFTLVAKIGPENAKVVVAPNDLRTGSPVTEKQGAPLWLPVLYEDIGRELKLLHSELPPARTMTYGMADLLWSVRLLQ